MPRTSKFAQLASATNVADMGELPTMQTQNAAKQQARRGREESPRFRGCGITQELLGGRNDSKEQPVEHLEETSSSDQSTGVSECTHISEGKWASLLSRWNNSLMLGFQVHCRIWSRLRTPRKLKEADKYHAI